jgi:hypothetical protein
VRRGSRRQGQRLSSLRRIAVQCVRRRVGQDQQRGLDAAKTETIEYFTREFRTMLEDNLDDYVKNFDQYSNR